MYVDDLQLVCLKSAVRKAKQQFSQVFIDPELGCCTQSLKIKIVHVHDGIFLSQKSMARHIVQSAGMESAKPVRSPPPLFPHFNDKRFPLSDKEGEDMVNVSYNTIQGQLLFLATRTRPDLATVVSMLAEYQSEYGLKH